MPGPGDICPHDIAVLERPAPDGPFGGKGPGEMCANPVLPAVANAIFNAVGVRIDDAAHHAGECAPSRPRAARGLRACREGGGEEILVAGPTQACQERLSWDGTCTDGLKRLAVLTCSLPKRWFGTGEGSRAGMIIATRMIKATTRELVELRVGWAHFGVVGGLQSCSPATVATSHGFLTSETTEVT
jgi:hypothetical protein